MATTRGCQEEGVHVEVTVGAVAARQWRDGEAVPEGQESSAVDGPVQLES